MVETAAIWEEEKIPVALEVLAGPGAKPHPVHDSAKPESESSTLEKTQTPERK